MSDDKEAAPHTGGGEYLFVHQNATGARNVSSSTVARQTRLWTSNRRTHDLRTTADQRAAYARSLVGWQSPTLLADAGSSSLNRPPNTDRQITLPPNISGGLRNDPFDVLPVRQPREIMGVADYFVHTWTKLKATNVDTLLGFNTYLKIYWPLAQQDELLMSALIGVARSAQCLSLGQHPSADAMVLQHGSRAFAELRKRLALGHINETIIFTMDWLINIAYMTSDRSAFNIHWSAFRPLAEGFITQHNDTLGTVVKHRLKSWETLHNYRAHVVQFQPVSGSQLTYVPGSQSFRGLPGGLSELVTYGYLAIQTAEMLLMLQTSISHDTPFENDTRPRLQSMLEREMTPLNLRVCLAAIAMSMSIDESLSDEFSVLGDAAQAFVNRPLEWPCDLGRRCLIWSSLIFGHVLLSLSEHPALPQTSTSPPNQLNTNFDPQIQHLRALGHIILISIWQTLLPPTPSPPSQATVSVNTSNRVARRPPSRPISDWASLSPALLRQEFILPPQLEAQLRTTYEAAMARQQRWDDDMLLEVGKPLATNEEGEPSVCVEYLVLREGRESLPAVY